MRIIINILSFLLVVVFCLFFPLHPCRQIIYLLVFVFILNHLVYVRIYVTPFSRVGLLVLC